MVAPYEAFSTLTPGINLPFTLYILSIDVKLGFIEIFKNNLKLSNFINCVKDKFVIVY